MKAGWAFGLALAAAGAWRAEACSCFSLGNILARRDSSEVAFVGRLVAEKVDTVQDVRKMRFLVQRYWRKGKRKRPKSIRVETYVHTEGCGFVMKVGETALVFANSSLQKGVMTYRTSLCAENIIDPTPAQRDSLWLKPASMPSKLP